MISRKKWVVLLFFYILYLFFGAWIFRSSEFQYEFDNLKKLHNKQRHLTDAISKIKEVSLRNDIKNSIQSIEELTGADILLPNSFRSLLTIHMQNFSSQNNFTIPDFVLSNQSLSDAILNGNFSQIQSVWVVDETGQFNESLFEKFWKDSKLDEDVAHLETMWTWYNSYFFSFQTITTIGFGKMAPKTHMGKNLLVLYSLFGVPFNGIVFASLADLFSKKFVKKIDNKRYEMKLMIIIDAILYLIPGIFIFFITPSLIFMIVEGWDYTSSIYYVFVTLNTIGFGDLVSGYVDLPTTLMWIYRVFIQCWILFGLGYLLMIISFIQKALRSKHVRSIDRKMTQLIRQRKKRTHNVQNDLEKLHAILNSIYMYQERNQSRIFDLNTKENMSNEKCVFPKNPYHGFVNRGYEYTGDEMEHFKMMLKDTFPARKLSNEMDPVEIFMSIASTVLKESEKKRLISRISSESLSDEIKIKDTDKHNQKTAKISSDGIVIEDVTEVEENNNDKVAITDDEHPIMPPNRKMHLRQLLLSWFMGVNQAAREGHSSCTETTSIQGPTDDDDDDDTKIDPNKITDLGDLIDKVGEIVNQEITERSDILQFTRTRSETEINELVDKPVRSSLP